MKRDINDIIRQREKYVDDGSGTIHFFNYQQQLHLSSSAAILGTSLFGLLRRLKRGNYPQASN
jgi:hypothetical protein